MPKTKLRRGTKTPRIYSPGRPLKPDKENWQQVTLFLKKTTIEQLKAGASSKYYGAFLEEHLAKYPLPSRSQYLNQKMTTIPFTVRRKRAPVIMGTLTPKLMALL